MQNGYSFRKAGLADKDQLKSLGIKAYGQYENVLGPEHWTKMFTSLNDESKLIELIKSSTTFVCEHKGKIVGRIHLIGKGNPWDIFQADWAYIRMLGIDPAHSGNGIAKKLTLLCLEEAKKNNEIILALHTSEFMNAARHIYESLGFKISKEIEPRFAKRYWLYTLDLN